MSKYRPASDVRKHFAYWYLLSLVIGRFFRVLRLQMSYPSTGRSKGHLRSRAISKVRISASRYGLTVFDR